MDINTFHYPIVYSPALTYEGLYTIPHLTFPKISENICLSVRYAGENILRDF